MHLHELPFEVLAQIFLLLGPFKVAKYRRVCRSFNIVLSAPPVSNLMGRVYIGHIFNKYSKLKTDVFCFVTPITFRMDFLRQLQADVASGLTVEDFVAHPLSSQNDVPFIVLESSTVESMSDLLPLEGKLQGGNFRLAGPLPSAISSLKQLTLLDLERLNLSGPIPRSVSNMTQLTVLNLKDNP
ncbi:hypothetical protein HDU81_007915, partial [Chytriomyces hyalinus]